MRGSLHGESTRDESTFLTSVKAVALRGSLVAVMLVVAACGAPWAAPRAANRAPQPTPVPTVTPWPTPSPTSTPLPPTPSPTKTPRPPAPTRTPLPPLPPTPTLPPNATLDQRIDAYIAGLTTTQLIGQTLMMSVCSSSYTAGQSQALTSWDVGSAIIYTSCGAGTEPATAAGLQQLDQALQSHANRPGSLLLATDEEGGLVDRLAPYYGSTPSAQQLAASGNPQTAYAQAQTDATRMRSLGLNVDLAPVVDVDQGGGEDPSRMFGTTVSDVDTYGGAFLDGLQQHGVEGTLKHWPGLGAATGDPDYVLPTVTHTQDQLNTIDFAPFRDLLSHQPGMIMVTTVMVSAYDAQRPAMLSPTLVTQVLRGQLGYQGVVITDALDGQGLVAYMQQQGYSNATQGIAEASVRAFLAGDDLLLCPLSQTTLQAIVSAMTQAVQSGRISQSQLHAAVHRIIRLKAQLGLVALP